MTPIAAKTFFMRDALTDFYLEFLLLLLLILLLLLPFLLLLLLLLPILLLLFFLLIPLLLFVFLLLHLLHCQKAPTKQTVLYIVTKLLSQQTKHKKAITLCLAARPWP